MRWKDAAGNQAPLLGWSPSLQIWRGEAWSGVWVGVLRALQTEGRLSKADPNPRISWLLARSKQGKGLQGGQGRGRGSPGSAEGKGALQGDQLLQAVPLQLSIRPLFSSTTSSSSSSLHPQPRGGSCRTHPLCSLPSQQHQQHQQSLLCTRLCRGTLGCPSQGDPHTSQTAGGSIAPGGAEGTGTAVGHL